MTNDESMKMKIELEFRFVVHRTIQLDLFVVSNTNLDKIDIVLNINDDERRRDEEETTKDEP